MLTLWELYNKEVRNKLKLKDNNKRGKALCHCSQKQNKMVQIGPYNLCLLTLQNLGCIIIIIINQSWNSNQNRIRITIIFQNRVQVPCCHFWPYIILLLEFDNTYIIFILNAQLLQQKSYFYKHVPKPMSTHRKLPHQYQHTQQKANCKSKNIRKQYLKDDSHEEMSYTHLSNKKKEIAKEIKRIRQQNRRANHKEYVTTLEMELQKKDQQIQILQDKIKILEQQLNNAICKKCKNVETDSSSLELEKQIICQEPEPTIDQQFRRITDDSALRICFGNKNLLFFLVTMCCLTTASIADNPEIFFQPIYPYMHISELMHLRSAEKMSHFNIYRKIGYKMSGFQGVIGQYMQTQPPELYNQIRRTSDMFQFGNIIDDLKLKVLKGAENFIQNMRGQKLLLKLGIESMIKIILEGRYYNI